MDCLFQCRQCQCEHSPYLSMCGLFVSVQTAPVSLSLYVWIVCFSADSASVNTVPISLCVDCLFQCRQRQCEHSPYLSMSSVNTVPISLCPYLSMYVWIVCFSADSASVNTVPISMYVWIVCFSADSASVNTVPISLCMCGLFVSVQTVPV